MNRRSFLTGLLAATALVKAPVARASITALGGEIGPFKEVILYDALATEVGTKSTVLRWYQKVGDGQWERRVKTIENYIEGAKWTES